VLAGRALPRNGEPMGAGEGRGPGPDAPGLTIAPGLAVAGLGARTPAWESAPQYGQ